MSVRANPTVIGAFVLGATIVLVAGLLFWGGTGMFRTKYRYVMYFETAVTGLQKGAPVVVRGVRIGDVTDVQVHWGTALVKVYVALDDFPGTRVVLRGFDTKVPELPTVPTDIEKWTAKIEKIADALGVLPLDEIGRSVIATLDEARRLLKSPEIASSLKSLDVILAETHGLVQKMDTLATNVNSQVDPLSTDAQAALVSAQAALAQVPALVQDVRRVVAKLDAHAEPLLTSLEKTSDTAGATLKRAQVTLGGVDGTLSQDSALGYELGKALLEVRETVRALGSLADFLERNPDALVYGIRRPAQNGR